MEFFSGINQVLLFAVLSLLTVALTLHVLDKLKKLLKKESKTSEHTLERIHQLDSSPHYQVQQAPASPAQQQIYYESPAQYQPENEAAPPQRVTREVRTRQPAFEPVISVQEEERGSRTREEKRKIDRNFVANNFK